MFRPGVLLHELGQAEEAEAWYRKATDAGHTNATHPANPPRPRNTHRSDEAKLSTIRWH